MPDGLEPAVPWAPEPWSAPTRFESARASATCPEPPEVRACGARNAGSLAGRAPRLRPVSLGARRP
jgi:hypothetical protein